MQFSSSFDRTISTYAALLIVTIVGAGAALFIMHIAQNAGIGNVSYENLDVLLKNTN